ncbi:hypothetical protein PSTEL_00565 [Paenibacillus stellifer]|uniref:Uncharacterized protein n=1 Tax=Paenibacillus stellifer TaxID=169760 RepID=A0A089LP20_9BACL|nr:hypothetical protein [Paenibacillus stellifer]AIQ61845.1 hypothetical protein PSTEL_00565 [Paenibacillus stellifer]
MNNSSRKLKHKEPIRSSFPKPILTKVHGEVTTRQMTEEDWAKYGPKSDIKRHGNHYMARPKKQKGDI